MQITGSITALATPFKASSRGAAGGIDHAAWAALLRAQLDGGSQGLVVAGSTGEAAALEAEEYAALLATAVAQVAGAVPVLAGTGASSTEKTVRQTRIAAALGASAALVVAPPYVRPTQEGMRRHFLEVAERGDLPVVLYNVPSRTACDLLPETVEQLAGHPRIVGIKEAVAQPLRMTALLGLCDEGFRVLSGDDPSACRAMLAGADGCISVAANVAPRAFRRLCDSARDGDTEGASRLDAQLAPLYDFLAIEPNPIPLKALLAQLGRCQDQLRLPLLPLGAAAREQLQRAAALVDTIEAT